MKNRDIGSYIILGDHKKFGDDVESGVVNPDKYRLIPSLRNSNPSLHFWHNPDCPACEHYYDDLRTLGRILKSTKTGLNLESTDTTDVLGGGNFLARYFNLTQTPTFLYRPSSMTFTGPGGKKRKGIVSQEFKPKGDDFIGSLIDFVDAAEKNEALTAQLREVKKAFETKVGRLF